MSNTPFKCDLNQKYCVIYDTKLVQIYEIFANGKTEQLY